MPSSAWGVGMKGVLLASIALAVLVMVGGAGAADAPAALSLKAPATAAPDIAKPTGSLSPDDARRTRSRCSTARHRALFLLALGPRRA
jgi:hypothetical protein